MIRGRILVIDGDEWLGRLLARVLQEKGFTTDFCEEARSGFQKACDTVPDCIVCSILLPDIDGFWVARRVRTESGPISKIPIVLVGDIADKDARIQGLQVGADVLLERPVTNEEIVAQVDALVAMARRFLGEPRDDHSAPSLAAAFRGDLSNFPLASVLMMLEMERRTGSLEVVSGSNKRALLTLSAGLFAHTEELSTDAQGRLVIPAALREYAGIEKDVVSIGSLTRVEVWSKARYDEHVRDRGDLPDFASELGLF